VAEERVEVLLVKRHLIQTRVDGRSHRSIIPNWAGQWGVIAARPLVSQSMEQTVQGAVLAQTGVDLSDPASAERYRIIGAQPHTLTDANNKTFAALFLTFLPEGLQAFAADAADRIGAGKVRDGVIDRLEIEPVAQALALLGPCAQPPEGWAGFVSSNRLRNREPGSLRSEGSMLISQLVGRSAMAPAAARLAVQTLAGCVEPKNTGASQASEKVVHFSELEILGARLHESGLWYQFYTPGQVISIHAVTTAPSAQELPIEWQGGEPDPRGRSDWRSLPLDRLSHPETPFTIQASLEGDRVEVRIAVVPVLIGMEVTRAHTLNRENGGSDTLATGATWVRAVLSPSTEEAFRHLNWYGGRADPNHPLDRRMVSLREIASDGKGVAVEANRALQCKPSQGASPGNVKVSSA
jgi:hypothetical protein